MNVCRSCFISVVLTTISFVILKIKIHFQHKCQIQYSPCSNSLYDKWNLCFCMCFGELYNFEFWYIQSYVITDYPKCLKCIICLDEVKHTRHFKSNIYIQNHLTSYQVGYHKWIFHGREERIQYFATWFQDSPDVCIVKHRKRQYLPQCFNKIINYKNKWGI